MRINGSFESKRYKEISLLINNKFVWNKKNRLYFIIISRMTNKVDNVLGVRKWEYIIILYGKLK